MYDTEAVRERVILISAESSQETEKEDSPDGLGMSSNIEELKLLAETSGAEVCGFMIQRREAAHPGHYFGKGKLEELKRLVNETGADAVIADDELTASQIRNMHGVLGVKIIDRTALILDIFAGRASSAEGRAQVELAQMKYRLSHLAGMGAMLSRQAGGGGFFGGGIGTRGPGEKKLETDRRHIRERISQLNHELDDIRENRAVLRGKRERSGIPVISLVGYTNAGKSTLMNSLTSAGAYTEDKLFATLDTTTRKLKVRDGAEVLVSDTVGFINKLPHQLIQAFRATLEELEYADILLHVADASNPALPKQMRVVYELLDSLGYLNKPVVTVFNKSDLITERDPMRSDPNAAKTIMVSAKTGDGIPELIDMLYETLNESRRRICVLIPFREGKWMSYIHENCEVISEEYNEEGTIVEAFADADTAGMLRAYAR